MVEHYAMYVSYYTHDSGHVRTFQMLPFVHGNLHRENFHPVKVVRHKIICDLIQNLPGSAGYLRMCKGVLEILPGFLEPYKSQYLHILILNKHPLNKKGK